MAVEACGVGGGWGLRGGVSGDGGVGLGWACE